MEQSQALVFVGGLVTIDEEEHIPLADSRKIADDLDVDHRSFFKMIVQYQEEIEAEFGQVRFKIAVGYRSQGGGNPQRYANLTEDQAYVYMTYTQNTDKARACKRKLVKGFMAAKAMLAQMPLLQMIDRENQVLTLTAEEIERTTRAIAMQRFELRQLQKVLHPPKPYQPRQYIQRSLPDEIRYQIPKFIERKKVGPSLTDLQNYMKRYSRQEIEQTLSELVKRGELEVERTPHTVRYQLLQHMEIIDGTN